MKGFQKIINTTKRFGRFDVQHSLAVLFLLLLLSACQSDRPEKENHDIDALPPSSEDYETNPYQWGFMKPSGELAITDQFDEVRAFSNGLALVRKQGHWGYVDEKGRNRIPCQYRAAWSFEEGLARIQTAEGLFGFIGQSGEIAIKPSWQEATDFREGLACVRVGGNYGFINTAGQMVIEPVYERSSAFNHAYAVIKKEGKYGMIDQKGSLIIPFDYQRLKGFSNELASASQDNKYGFLNKKGKWVIQPNFVQVADFKNEFAAAFDGKKWGLINKKGDWKLKPAYDQIYWAANNRWITETDGLYQLINEKATVLTDSLDEIHPFKENFAPYRKGELWGYLKMNGQVNITPSYYLAWPYHDGLARVATEYGLNYIDSSGFLLLSPRPDYLELREFDEGLAPVQIYRPH